MQPRLAGCIVVTRVDGLVEDVREVRAKKADLLGKAQAGIETSVPGSTNPTARRGG